MVWSSLVIVLNLIYWFRQFVKFRHKTVDTIYIFTLSKFKYAAFIISICIYCMCKIINNEPRGNSKFEIFIHFEQRTQQSVKPVQRLHKMRICKNLNQERGLWRKRCGKDILEVDILYQYYSHCFYTYLDRFSTNYWLNSLASIM